MSPEGLLVGTSASVLGTVGAAGTSTTPEGLFVGVSTSVLDTGVQQAQAQYHEVRDRAAYFQGN